MKHLLTIMKIIFSLLLCFNIFIWIIAQGTGHNIPLKTNLIFGIRSFLLLVLLLLSVYWKRRKNIKVNKNMVHNHSDVS
jgi:hypothetical protein